MTGWFLVFLLKTTAIGLIALLALGWLQNLHPAFDSFSHFRQVFCVALAAVIVLLLFFAPWFWVTLSVASLAVSLMLSYPYLPGFNVHASKTKATASSVKIMQFNLRFNNRKIDAIAAAILSEEADVVLMQELTPANFGLLDMLKDRFPYQLECNSKVNGSVALVSQHPFATLSQQDCMRKLGFVHAQLNVSGRELTVASFHSKWPWPDRQFFQIGALEETISNLSSPLILAGDFNAAPWSAAVQRVARLSGTTVLRGALLTWKPIWKDRRDILPPLLPLDQIMASGEFIPIDRRRVKDGGSDHLPVLTEFHWK
ncbi:MAG: endonuclease/exonuclease/phosphatase family protein [Rhizobiaceae bacterium]